MHLLGIYIFYAGHLWYLDALFFPFLDGTRCQQLAEQVCLRWIECYLFAVHQAHQALTAADVVSDVAVRQPVDHGTVVHHVAAEQQLVVAVVEADAAPRVARHVKHRQLPVAKVDDVTYA